MGLYKIKTPNGLYFEIQIKGFGARCSFVKSFQIFMFLIESFEFNISEYERLAYLLGLGRLALG